MIRYTCSVFILLFLLASCSDAEVISGNYSGTFYGTDTVPATGKVSFLSDSYVGIEIRSTYMQLIYTEHAQIEKNSDISYNLFLKDNNGTMILSGYYYDTFIHINAISSGYVFEGNK